MKLIDFLADKNIAILGFGKQGKATYNYLKNNFPNKKITVIDKSSNIDVSLLSQDTELRVGDNYLKNIEEFDLIIKAPGVVLKDIDVSKFEDKLITDYELLLKSGANFASSPKRINIHALDPALIAISLSLLDKNKEVDLIGLLNKTSNGIDGIGGVNTKGVLRKGYPK